MENLTATFRNTSAKTLEKAKVMADYTGPQETEVKVGNKHTANGLPCFLQENARQRGLSQPTRPSRAAASLNGIIRWVSLCYCEILQTRFYGPF